jgi:phosphoribosyl 1,2-cyclic phosphodiesterase
MLRFKNLGSGSTGNATLVETDDQRPFRLLVDCGFGIRQLQLRLASAGLLPADIGAIFITHEHSDHVGCVRSMALRYRIPVWMSRGTYTAIGEPDFEALLRIAHDGEAIALNGLEVMPFTVPHDAREPLQIRCSDGSSKLGILTDLGHATPHVLAQLEGCHALLLECNHDPELLAQSTYPAFLKRRVGGHYGHLSNTSAADIARVLMHHKLKHMVAAHLSAQNNRADLAQVALAEAMCCGGDDILVARPDVGTCWMDV